MKTSTGLALAAICSALTGCRSAHAVSEPAIEFTSVPAATQGSPDRLDPIEGRVAGARPSDRLVLYALSGVWWVQPFAEKPFTEIQPDSRWKSLTHPGISYAALLVDGRYRPPLTLNSLPEKGGPVRALATAKGTTPSQPAPALRFSGYQWEIRQISADLNNSRKLFAAANAWTDKSGFLHLRISEEQDHWVSADVRLSRSLGYGSYRWVVQDVSHLEPAAVLALFTWDDLGPSREMDIEISRWGEPEDKNGQFIVQPWIVPQNTVRFNTPAGTLTYWMNWQPGRVAFKIFRWASSNNGAPAAAEHVFTSGVAVAGNERIRINMYPYDNARHPLRHESEVVLEEFEYLP